MSCLKRTILSSWSNLLSVRRTSADHIKSDLAIRAASLTLMFATTVPAMAVEADKVGSQWQAIALNMYIKSGPPIAASFGKVRVRVLNSYDEISSAQMFGLSDVDEVEFDCLKSRYRSLSDKWYEGKMATGRITNDDATPHKWSPIPSFYIKLFASSCAP